MVVDMWHQIVGGLMAAFGVFLILAHSSMIPSELNPLQHEGFTMKKLGLGILLFIAGIYIMIKL